MTRATRFAIAAAVAMAGASALPQFAAAQATHGTWTRGPGTYTVRICGVFVDPGSPRSTAPGVTTGTGRVSPGLASGAASNLGRAQAAQAPAMAAAATAGRSATSCDITAAAGTQVPVMIQVWGGGGGGGGGTGRLMPGTQASVGMGGGGGGGGGYATLNHTLTAPLNGAVVWSVTVGAGGTAGPTAILSGQPNPNATVHGGNGGTSQVRVGSATGQILASATGGAGGWQTYQKTGAGAPGTGSVNSWTGTAGYPGSGPQTCSGGAGGYGGAGGGPGRTAPGYVNDGGDGGHGGYNQHIPQCTAQDNLNGISNGRKGGDGKVTLTW